MKLVVYSASQSFRQFLARQVDASFEFRVELKTASLQSDAVHLLHISSLGQSGYNWIKQISADNTIKTGVCSDLPNILEMLECVQSGASAYCNSYMAVIHFRQMLRMLEDGQSWYPPHMLEQTFKLAHGAAQPPGRLTSIEALTNRETEIALAVADGKSNRQIANQFAISEPTVKTHLTNIFRKLEIRDRVALVLHLKAS